MEDSLPHINLKAFFSHLRPPLGQEYLLWVCLPSAAETPIPLAVYSSKEEGEKAATALRELSHYQDIHLTPMGSPLLVHPKKSDTKPPTEGEEVIKPLDTDPNEQAKTEANNEPTRPPPHTGRVLLPPRRGYPPKINV